DPVPRRLGDNGAARGVDDDAPERVPGKLAPAPERSPGANNGEPAGIHDEPILAPQEPQHLSDRHDPTEGPERKPEHQEAPGGQGGTKLERRTPLLERRP